MIETPFSILELTPDADQKAIDAAWRHAAAINHPDRGGDPELFQKFREAYKSIRAQKDRERLYAYLRMRYTECKRCGGRGTIYRGAVRVKCTTCKGVGYEEASANSG